jgi:hypothetical protein
MNPGLRSVLIVTVLAALVACARPAAPSVSPPPIPSAAGCSVVVEPEITAPGGWSFVVGRGFQAHERVSWSGAAEDGSLDAKWDSDGFEPMRPDGRGGFGFGLGSPDREGIGHTISATITSPSCTAHASFRVEADNEQTRPLPSDPPASCATDPAAVDRIDDTSDHLVHLIYAVPSDVALDPDINRHIVDSFAHIEVYLRDRLDGRAFRMDRCDGNLDVTVLQLERTAAAYAEMRAGFVQGLELDLVRHGFRYGQKLYAVVWGGLAQWARLDDGCGGEAGSHGVAVSFLRSIDGDACAPLGTESPIGEPDTGLAHEIVHLLGLPASCGKSVDDGGHVVDDPSDLMYGRGHTTADAIDAGHDDYYRHDIDGCPDLADSAFLDPPPDDPELPAGWPSG